jgi:hypothetical protein
MNRHAHKLGWMLAGAALWACGVASQNSNELDTVITAPADGADFTQIQTYRLAEHVVDLTPGYTGTDGGVALADPVLETALLNQVKLNLNATGLVEAPAPDVTAPDVLVLVSVQRQDFVQWTTVGFWSAWAWYPGWNWWGGAGFGWTVVYPTSVVSLDVSAGSLHVDMARPLPDHSVSILWSAVINSALIDGPTSQQLLGFIDQAFAQSPYLRGDR